MPTLLRPWQDLERVTQEWRLSVVTPASALPVTVSELKQHARLHFPGEADPYAGEEDDALERLITAATQELGAPVGWLGRSIMLQTLRLTLDMPPPSVVRLPGIPVSSIVSVVYIDSSEVTQTIAEAAFIANGYEYDIDDTGSPALIWNEDWPSTYGKPGRLKINYIAGYATAAAVPAIIRQWILMRAAGMYRDREPSIIGGVAMKLESFERMLDNYRVRM